MHSIAAVITVRKPRSRLECRPVHGMLLVEEMLLFMRLLEAVVPSGCKYGCHIRRKRRRIRKR
eukprot:963851-Rhodomonas_salina.2